MNVKDKHGLQRLANTDEIKKARYLNTDLGGRSRGLRRRRSGSRASEAYPFRGGFCHPAQVKERGWRAEACSHNVTVCVSNFGPINSCFENWKQEAP